MIERRVENTEPLDTMDHLETNVAQQPRRQGDDESNSAAGVASDYMMKSFKGSNEASPAIGFQTNLSNTSVVQERVQRESTQLRLVEDLGRENHSSGPDIELSVVHVTNNFFPDELLLPNSKILGNEISTRRRHVRFIFDVADVLIGDLTLRSLEDQAIRLLRCLEDMNKGDILMSNRITEDKSQRTAIVFVAYDLGALIVKQALAIAARDNYQWPGIFARSSRVVFWGCPHRGATRRVLESDLFRLIQTLTNKESLSCVSSTNEIKWLADAVIYTTCIFFSSKVTLSCRVVSVYGNKNGSGNIPHIFDRFSATLGDPLETAVEELDRGNNDWPSPSFAEQLCLRVPDWALPPKGIPIEQALRALAAPPRQSTLRVTSLPKEILDAKEHREWFEGNGHQLLYIHGQSSEAVQEAAEQIVSSYKPGIWNKGASGIGYFSFAFSSHDPNRSSITSMITTYLAQRVSGERSNDGYEWLSDQFTIQNAWTREDLLGLLSTGWWFNFNDQVVIVFLQDFDECDDNDRSHFLHLWNKKANSNETILKLVVTSRKRGALLTELRDWPALEVDNIHCHISRDSEKAIQTSPLENRLETLCRHCYDKVDRTTIQKRLRELFSSFHNSETLDTILDLVQDHSGWPAEPSEASLGHFIRLLDRISSGLSVESALDVILRSDGENLDILQKVIAWMLYSWRPLSTWELATIVCLDKYRGNRQGSVDLKASAQIHALVKIRIWLRGMFNESHGQIRFKRKIRHLMRLDDTTRTNYIWNTITRSQAHSMIFDFCLEYLDKPSVYQRLISQHEIYISRIKTREGALVPPLIPDGKDLMFFVVQSLPHCLSHRKSIPARKIYLLLKRVDKPLDAWAKIWWDMSNPFSRPRECPTSAKDLLTQLDLIRSRNKNYSNSPDLVVIGAVISGQGARVDGILKNNVLPDAVLIHALSEAVKIGEENIAISIAEKVFAHQWKGESLPGWNDDGPGVTKRVVKWPHTMIWRAAWLGLGRLAKLLLRTGADANGGGVTIQFAPSPLFLACRLGHAAIVTQLLSHGARTDINRGTNTCVLHAAIIHGYYPEIINSLFLKNKNELLEYSKPETPLSRAVLNGNWQATMLLLQHGADPHAGITEANNNADIWSPLCTASSLGLVKTMKALLEGGADANICAPWGRDTPLWFAAVATASTECCESLLNAGADPNHRLFRPPIMVELMKSSTKSSEAILKVSNILLHHKQPVRLDDADTTNGRTALMYAATRRQYGSTLVHWLLRNGADINATDLSGKSAIFHAIQAGNVAVVRELLSWDLLDLKIKSEVNPRTVLEAALLADTDDASVNCNLIDMLITAGADPEANIDGGARILNLAVQKGNTEIVQILLARNVKLNHRDRLGWMPVHDAIGYSSNARLVRLLAEAGASLQDVLERSGRGVLHIAVTEDPDILIVLLQFHRELKLEKQDGDGNTPLLVTGIRLECARLMIRAGANVNARDAMGNTPLVKAVHACQTELVDLLMSEPDIELGSALHVACQTGHVDLVMKLLGHATNTHVNQKLPIRHSTPLLAAIIPQGHLLGHRDPENTHRIVRALIDKGASVQETISVSHSTIFYSAIAAAAFSGPLACITLLLNEGASDQTIDPLGRLPIHFAAAGGVKNLQMVTFTQRERFDMVKDAAGKTCLHWAAQHGRARAIEAILREMGNKERSKHINEPDIDGWTPLCWAIRACYEGHTRHTVDESDRADYLSTVKHLIKHGADSSVECSIQKGLNVGAESFTVYKLACRYRARSDVADLIRPKPDQQDEDTRPYSLGERLCDVCFCYIHGLSFSCNVCIDFWVCNKCYGRISLYHGHFKTEQSQPHTFSSSSSDEFDCQLDPLVNTVDQGGVEGGEEGEYENEEDFDDDDDGDCILDDEYGGISD